MSPCSPEVGRPPSLVPAPWPLPTQQIPTCPLLLPTPSLNPSHPAIPAQEAPEQSWQPGHPWVPRALCRGQLQIGPYQEHCP